MQPTQVQSDLLKRLANDNDGKILSSFIKDIVSFYADVRNLSEPTNEEIKARQLMCSLLEKELLSRLQIKSEKKEITEEYE